ncbi:MAG: DNA polymerase IV [Candidatus Promineifilaceae bacterium]
MAGRQNPPDVEWSAAILHLDMDAFYVNVYIQDHPEDNGIPLVVGGRPDQRGVVSSASYEARQLGIHSAMPTSRARRICPDLKIVPADWGRIRERSRQVMAVLQPYGAVEQISVDEAYVDLGGHADPLTAAAAVKREVQNATGLPCSVGLATSKLVAKVASDHDKPDGFTVVLPGKEAAFLAPLPTRAIWGIGPRTSERLAALHIVTCAQLAAAALEQLRPVLGNQAALFVERAQGIDTREVSSQRGQAKSISQEWTFNRDVSDQELLEQQLHTMSTAVAQSLRKKGLVAHTVTIKIRWADFTTFTRQKSYEVPFDGEREVKDMALALFREHWSEGQLIRLLGVGVSNLGTPEARQLRLPLDSGKSR